MIHAHVHDRGNCSTRENGQARSAGERREQRERDESSESGAAAVASTASSVAVEIALSGLATGGEARETGYRSFLVVLEGGFNP